MLIQHINVKMNKDMVKAAHKIPDFIIRNKILVLHFVFYTRLIQKIFLVIMKRLQTDIENFIGPEFFILHM